MAGATPRPRALLGTCQGLRTSANPRKAWRKMTKLKHIALAAALFAAPFLACSSATTPAASDAGGGGG